MFHPGPGILWSGCLRDIGVSKFVESGMKYYTELCTYTPIFFVKPTVKTLKMKNHSCCMQWYFLQFWITAGHVFLKRTPSWHMEMDFFANVMVYRSILETEFGNRFGPNSTRLGHRGPQQKSRGGHFWGGWPTLSIFWIFSNISRSTKLSAHIHHD